jgi:NADH-quinone oxidoreductase subunit J
VGLLVFVVAAALAVAGGIGVIAFHEPIRSVLSLVVVMVALSILFLLLSAQFVFVVQIIVYAGAVMVLFLFVVALLGPARELGRGRLRFQPWLAALFSVVFAVLVWVMLQGVQYRQPAVTDLKVFGTVQWVAVQLFTKYLYPFELTSLLLLVAAIGAIYLSKRNIEGESPVEGLRPAADDGGTLPPKSEDL